MKKKIKLKSTDFSNLHSKTVYDFCDDEEFLYENLSVSKDKEREINELLNNPSANMSVFFDFAEQIKNKELYKAIEQQFKEEYAKIHNE